MPKIYVPIRMLDSPMCEWTVQENLKLIKNYIRRGWKKLDTIVLEFPPPPNVEKENTKIEVVILEKEK